MTRFRCRAGHAFSARCLLDELARAREQHLASLFGLLSGEAALARRMLNNPVEHRMDSDGALSDRLAGVEREASQVSDWLWAPDRLDEQPTATPKK